MFGKCPTNITAIMVLVLATSTSAGGEERAVVVSPSLSLDEALELARTRGLDVLIAEAGVHRAEGNVDTAGAVANPAITLGYGRTFNYVAQSSDQSNKQYSAGLSDQAAAFDMLSGKRGLRLAAARNALAAAKLARRNAVRVLQFEVKQQYVLVAQAIKRVRFAQEVVDTATQSLELNRRRYPQVIDDGALARIETQKLEADQAFDEAVDGLRTNRVILGFLLGVRSEVPDFDVDTDTLDYRVPPALATASERELLRVASEHRPDLQQYRFERARASAALDLARRQRFPDVTLSAQYTQTGTGQSAIQPPTVSFAITTPLPLFYHQQGEIRRAAADYDEQSLAESKVAAQVTSEVGVAFAGFVAAKRMVERMQGGLLDSAKRARDVTEVQFKAGAGTLIDFLDAQRTYAATNVEYLQDLTTYRTAVFQLEQAVGMEFP
jgi:cobalt-zinc-cadmium efflux system outer membrane protein